MRPEEAERPLVARFAARIRLDKGRRFLLQAVIGQVTGEVERVGQGAFSISTITTSKSAIGTCRGANEALSREEGARGLQGFDDEIEPDVNLVSFHK